MGGSLDKISEIGAMDLTARHVTLIMAGITLLLDTSHAHWNPLVDTCPGEGSRYGDFKCIHRQNSPSVRQAGGQHGQLLHGGEVEHGHLQEVSFWDITGQQRWNWKERICSAPNPGDSRCICM